MSEPVTVDTTKLQILLAEYSSLRAESVAKGTHMVTMNVAVGGAFGVFIGAIVNFAHNLGTQSRAEFWISVGAFVIPFAAVFVYAGIYRAIYYELGKVVSRVAEIEIDVNDRVKEDLLVWERLCGAAKTGWLGGPCFPREKLKDSPKPVRTYRGDPLPPRDGLDK
jgi:hypothetical protein